LREIPAESEAKVIDTPKEFHKKKGNPDSVEGGVMTILLWNTQRLLSLIPTQNRVSLRTGRPLTKTKTGLLMSQLLSGTR
jgi:hypothetical protein